MEKVFSDKTEEGIRLIWMQFDPEKTAEGVRLLREAADAGDPDALCFLARTYMGERYVWEYAALEISGEKAASLLKEGIRRGSACAVLLAMRCGELTPSARKAMPFASLKEARDDVLGKAEAGHPFCQYMIGNTYYFGDCFEIDGIDPQTAFHDPDGLRADTARHALPWLEKALNGGLSDAAKNLYNLFSGSEGFPRDRGRQWEIALRGAAAGNPYWEEWCGKMCREEHGREAEAMRWFRQAAHHGQASSWFHIGSHYEHGLGVDKDPAKAAEAYRNGAEKGSSDAQQSLGIMAAFGRGVPQDPAQAAYWLRLAADDEKPLACGVLGHCYLRGLGVQQDDGEAFVLLDRFDEAYDREEPDDGETSTYPDELVGIVYNGLGELYADGRGGPVDIKEGVRCFQAAAELGNGDARRNLGRFKRNWFGKWVRKYPQAKTSASPSKIMRMSGGRFHRHPGIRVVFPFSLRFPGHRVRPPSFHPLFMAPQYPRRFPRQPSFSAIQPYLNQIPAHRALERGPAQKALSRSSQGCHPTLPSQPKYGLRVATSRCSASN